MEPVSIVTLLGFGFLLGLRHAIEADHLAAVSTIVTQRKSAWSASLVGGLWGVGHTISLFAAGILVIAFHVEISPAVEQTLEFCVAMMLIILGVDSLRRIFNSRQVHMHSHRHGSLVHFHPHTHEAASEHSHGGVVDHTHVEGRIGYRPLIIGITHGLAGSGALMLLVLATISSPATGFAYILVFGIGSIAGMMLMSLLLGVPTSFTARRFQFASSAIRMCASGLSIGLGIYMAYQIVV